MIFEVGMYGPSTSTANDTNSFQLDRRIATACVGKSGRGGRGGRSGWCVVMEWGVLGAVRDCRGVWVLGVFELLGELELRAL